MNNCDKTLKPYNQSDQNKEPSFKNLNYTHQDFWSLKERLREFMLERFGPDGTEIPNTFNDFIESSIAIMEMEKMAFIGDTLSFKIDQQFNENFLSSVTQVENAFKIAKQFGMIPQPPISARSFWVASISTPIEKDIIIPTPINIETSNGQKQIRIELFPADSEGNPIFDQDIIISAGKFENKSVVGLEGFSLENEFSGDGEISQVLNLTNGPVIYDSVRVYVNGSAWESVDYFTDSQPRKEYIVEYDSQFNAYIKFGNNRAGLIPSKGSRILIYYRVGGGTQGNIVTDYIEAQRQVFVQGLKFNIPILYRNYTKGEFGYNGDGIEEIRRKLPKFLKTQDRIVSIDDYKNFSDIFTTPYQGQIGKSTAVLRHYGCSANIIDLYVLARDGEVNLNQASNELKVALLDAIEEKKMITHDVCIKDGFIVYTDVVIDIKLDRKYRKFELENQNIVDRLVSEFFILESWDYNKDLKSNDLIKEISSVREFNEIDITFITDDEDNSGQMVISKFYEIIRPDDIQISFIYE